ncbi:MAG: DUF1311 domain-containing protein [Paracoccus sp. (in: a-proteobacteria)]|uniref:lysozyme inhibitor LprI family protein n=1 Tax=Paracoccus sp. TaxID=267 RepID=UPI0039E28D72
MGRGPVYDDRILPVCLIGEAATVCVARPGGDTTAGMVDCLAVEGADWDKRLNLFYERAMKQAAPTAPVLKASRRDWPAYRDCSCHFQAIRFRGGTKGGSVAATCPMELTGLCRAALRSGTW